MLYIGVDTRGSHVDAIYLDPNIASYLNPIVRMSERDLWARILASGIESSCLPFINGLHTVQTEKKEIALREGNQAVLDAPDITGLPREEGLHQALSYIILDHVAKHSPVFADTILVPNITREPQAKSQCTQSSDLTFNILDKVTDAHMAPCAAPTPCAMEKSLVKAQFDLSSGLNFKATLPQVEILAQLTPGNRSVQTALRTLRALNC